ncbi:MAG: MarR family transcriptional regulator [Bacteroidales bacterium]|nr:MarR family transcriptional regulator [Bacteroidales bacterium]MDD3989098.1 MarR family transcriptional regulator [Bacteroidales bacterium]MDD4639472.1 MarR family transcriptional regulator [Bacteroidales bacterium]
MKRLTEAISHLSNFMAQTEEEVKERINSAGITQTQMHHIETVGELANPTVTELAKALGLSKPTVTVAVDRLIEKECICRIRSDIDRRQTHLHLTEKGKELNQIHHLAHIMIARNIIKNLTQDEIESFIKIVEKI